MDISASEVIIIPEMAIAGEEALREARVQGLNDGDTAIAVYIAMQAVYGMAILVKRNGTVH